MSIISLLIGHFAKKTIASNWRPGIPSLDAFFEATIFKSENLILRLNQIQI
jgi:hypothetical protein